VGTDEVYAALDWLGAQQQLAAGRTTPPGEPDRLANLPLSGVAPSV
jgi:hypothetical protein